MTADEFERFLNEIEAPSLPLPPGYVGYGTWVRKMDPYGFLDQLDNENRNAGVEMQ